MRKKVIAANWKMNKTPAEAREFMDVFVNLVKGVYDSEIVIFVPYIDLFIMQDITKNTNIKIGAQNVHHAENGAYTGEISVKMLREMNVEYVIIGHSERRQYYNENDENVNKKLKAVLDSGIKPIVCIGETIEQRQAGIAREFVSNQVRNALKGLTKEEVEKTIMAYEPIWAISTSGIGQVATKEDADEACGWVRDAIREIYGDIADNVIVQYGGSVNPSNALGLFGMSNIDGGLVGGASLKPEDFAGVVNYNK